MFENAFTGGSHLRFTQVSWYSGVHEGFTVFYVVHPTFKNEKSCRCINHTFSECNRQQFDMQLVYYIRLKFEIMLTFIFQSCEW